MTDADRARQQATRKSPVFEVPFQRYQQDVAIELVKAYGERTGRGAEKIAVDVYRASEEPESEKTAVVSQQGLVTRQDIANWLAKRNYLGDEKFRRVWTFVNHPSFQSIVNE